MSKYFGLWYGGSNYAVGSIEESMDTLGSLIGDLEVFDSIADAKAELLARYNSGWYMRATVKRPNGTVEQVATPTVDESSEIQLWASDPRGVRDPYPDMRVYFGPRGGVRVEKL